MTAGPPGHRPLTQEEVLATDQAFVGVSFGPTLSLDDADLSERQFERCLFQVPMIRGANFSGSTFKDCRFEPTRIANCKFRGTRVADCTFFDLAQKKGSTFAFCELPDAKLVKSNFAMTVFERCDLYNVRVVECSFRGVRFNRSTFTKSLSRRTVLSKACFDQCNLSFADLSGLHLQRCEFLSCKLSEASFIGSDLSHATMIACALERAEWDRAVLREADLRGSQLSGLNLAVLADYAGLTISEGEQAAILEALGVIVR